MKDNERLAAAVAVYGFNPETVGIRHRGWWIVEQLDEDEIDAGAKIGDLCVKSRDGGSNPPDMDAGAKGLYRGTVCDAFDYTYRYYYYAPIKEATNG